MPDAVRRPQPSPGRLAWAALSLGLLLLPGCTRIKQQMQQSFDKNDQVRQGAIDSARKSCIQTASAKLPANPALQLRINDYCDCFAKKGLGQFSNSELAGIGFSGGKLTPDQTTKVERGVAMCKSELIGSSQ